MSSKGSLKEIITSAIRSYGRVRKRYPKIDYNDPKFLDLFYSIIGGYIKVDCTLTVKGIVDITPLSGDSVLFGKSNGYFKYGKGGEYELEIALNGVENIDWFLGTENIFVEDATVCYKGR